MRSLRHVTSINDLTNPEIEHVFALAAQYLKRLGDKDIPYRIAKSAKAGEGHLLATLFYEPSTRTRLSFESAMLRLGGKTISSADPNASSAAKGESLADSVRMLSNYADAIVVRHKRDGAARLAAEYAHVPIINGGDGAHEHPTQTLGDLFTLRRENAALKNLNVAVAGDLKHGRTIHSLVYALARFGSRIVLMPAPGMGLPEHVRWRLKHEFPGTVVSEADQDNPIDVLYVTRFQAERATNEVSSYPRIDLKFLGDKKFSRARVMHPLPRVNELDIDVDRDARATYFQQAAYAVPVRMALLATVLGLSEKKFTRYAGGFRKAKEQLYAPPASSGVACANTNCIVHDEIDGKYSGNKFYILPSDLPRLRCFYCETDIADVRAVQAATREKPARTRSAAR
jgi:aspartate carbamoyltransferase catalytic subunit